MSRPLTGRRTQANGRFYAELPRSRGATQRVRAAFDHATDRDTWLDAAVAAVNAGHPVPDPGPYQRDTCAAPVAAGTKSERSSPTFEELAHGWLDEYYGQLKNGNGERARDARIMVERHLIPAFAGPIPADPRRARKRLIEFVRRLALEPEWENALAADPGADPGRLMTIRQATAACERSQSTIRRALRAGRLPGARRGSDGQWLIPSGDLRTAGLLRQAAVKTAFSRSYVSDILWVHGRIIEWGRQNGWEIPDFARGVHALTPDDEVARRAPGSDLRRPLSIAEIGRVASHLHVVHQLVLWLMRVLGLRISEAFGPRVGDIVDLGEIGLAFITAQGGRPFLTRCRTGGVVTRYTKRTLKRAASYRVIVVPPALMAAIRVAIEAFHTDPITGTVDLEARLVPWIEREDRGQAAFRAGLEMALTREGFDLDSSGFEVTSHDLRKSLATDLAWNSELDELAKRRVMGHKAGDDVFARVYTLDHPSIAPLAAVARAVEEDINLKVNTLLVATEERVKWGAGNPLRSRAGHIDAVLAESGWQIEPGEPSNPWCDTARVAAELGIAPTTARRWMRDQVIPSVVDIDEHKNPRRRARLADVHEVRDRLAERLLLRDVADDMGVGYHPAWHAMHRLGMEASRDPRTDELLLTSEQAATLRGEFTRIADLKGRSIRLSAAATRLGVAVSTVQRFVTGGQLEEDTETDPSGARYVTLASLNDLVGLRTKHQTVDVGTDVLSVAVVAQLTGLTKQQISDLTARRLLERSDLGRRLHVTTGSLRRWAVGYRPDLLAAIEEAVDHNGRVSGSA